MNNFLRRTLTGAWIVIFILGGLWLHPVSFFIVGLTMITGMIYEYYQIMANAGKNPQMAAGIATAIFVYILATLVAAGWLKMKFLLLLIIPFSAIIIIELYRKLEKPFDSLAHTFLPLFYIAVPVSLFPFAAFSHEGITSLLPHKWIVFSPGIVIGFILLIWANDVGAYLAGSTLGRHRLMERISPKKSWEGFIGGAFMAIIAAWLISGWLNVFELWKWIVISLIVTIAGTFGDLSESMLKRSIGIKDSGTIMPGHGGFLDRFDSTIFAFPIIFLFISLFG